MRLRSGMILILAGLALNACAAAGTAGGGGPLVSPTGRQYEPGTPPRQTRFAQAALLAVAQGRFEVGLEEARAGIAADSANPIHYYLAGEAAAGLGEYDLADSMWVQAERIYPAYELEVEPSRESAWVEAFNAGVEAYNAGETGGAIENWAKAHQIYKLRPDAAQNLAVVLTQEERYPEAIATYREAITNLDLEPATRIIEAEEQAEREEVRSFMEQSLAELLLYTGQFADAETLIRRQLERNPDSAELQASLANALARQGRTAEANEIYGRLLTMPGLPAVELFNIGVALFQAEEFQRAAQAFARVLQVQTNSRDAIYNQANALYAAEAWSDLIPVAQRLIQIDPLNSTGALMLARAHRETGNNAGAQQTIAAIDALPVFIEDMQLVPSASQTIIQGTMTGNRAAAGSPIRLRFTFYNDQGGTIGTETATIPAPAAQASSSFNVTFGQVASAYSYQLEQ